MNDHERERRAQEAREKHRAEMQARVEQALGDPGLKAALQDLKSQTPEGEAMFGFQVKVKTADARAEVPSAETIDATERPAIVTQREAAAAYVAAKVPARLSPRMPTGRIKVPMRAEEIAQRRQATMPSLRKREAAEMRGGVADAGAMGEPIEEGARTERSGAFDEGALTNEGAAIDEGALSEEAVGDVDASALTENAIGDFDASAPTADAVEPVDASTLTARVDAGAAEKIASAKRAEAGASAVRADTNRTSARPANVGTARAAVSTRRDASSGMRRGRVIAVVSVLSAAVVAIGVWRGRSRDGVASGGSETTTVRAESAAVSGSATPTCANMGHPPCPTVSESAEPAAVTSAGVGAAGPRVNASATTAGSPSTTAKATTTRNDDVYPDAAAPLGSATASTEPNVTSPPALPVPDATVTPKAPIRPSATATFLPAPMPSY